MSKFDQFNPKVYLICKEVDLGYHVIDAYKLADDAQKAFDLLVKKHNNDPLTHWEHPYFQLAKELK